jgi:competence CoiA-like predicted nuclease
MSLVYGILDSGEKIHIADYDKDTKEKIYSPLGKELVAKKGPIYVHHYAHKYARDRDAWSHPQITKWHYSYQEICNSANVEVRISKNGKTHIADILNEDNVVIELQHSYISDNEIKERENFYDNMIWIFDCLSDSGNCKGEIFFDTKNISLIKLPGHVKNTTKPSFYDFGSIVYKYIGLLYSKNNTKKIWCKKYTKKDFINKYFKNIVKASYKFNQGDIYIQSYYRELNINLKNNKKNNTIIAIGNTYNVKNDLKFYFVWQNNSWCTKYNTIEQNKEVIHKSYKQYLKVTYDTLYENIQLADSIEQINKLKTNDFVINNTVLHKLLCDQENTIKCEIIYNQSYNIRTSVDLEKNIATYAIDILYIANYVYHFIDKINNMDDLKKIHHLIGLINVDWLKYRLIQRMDNIREKIAHNIKEKILHDTIINSYNMKELNKLKINKLIVNNNELMNLLYSRINFLMSEIQYSILHILSHTELNYYMYKFNYKMDDINNVLYNIILSSNSLIELFSLKTHMLVTGNEKLIGLLNSRIDEFIDYDDGYISDN